MPHYLAQVGYTSEGWQAVIRDPEGRQQMVRNAVEKLGGKVLHTWFAFGDYDVVGIAEMPDNVAAAALAMAVAAGGACRSVKTTPLLSTAEALDAMKKAGQSGYRAATTGS